MAEEARMRLPKAPEAAMEEVAITGLGYGERGNFRIANKASGQDEAGGIYVRRAHSGNFFDVGGDVGHVEFTLHGDQVRGKLAAFCRYSQGDVGVSDGVRLTFKPLSYSCKMERDGYPIEARLNINERALLSNERRGSVSFEGQTMELRSVHKMRGSKVPSGTPVGYVFLQDGKEIGGVDTNGLKINPVFLPRNSELRDAALMASIALFLFWDPGDGDRD